MCLWVSQTPDKDVWWPAREPPGPVFTARVRPYSWSEHWISSTARSSRLWEDAFLKVIFFYTCISCKSENQFCWSSCINPSMCVLGVLFVVELLLRKKRKKTGKVSSPLKVWLPQAIDSVLNIWNRIQNDSCIWVNTSNIQKCIKLNHVIYRVAVKLQIALENMFKKNLEVTSTIQPHSFVC